VPPFILPKQRVVETSTDNWPKFKNVGLGIPTFGMSESDTRNVSKPANRTSVDYQFTCISKIEPNQVHEDYKIVTGGREILFNG